MIRYSSLDLISRACGQAWDLGKPEIIDYISFESILYFPELQDLKSLKPSRIRSCHYIPPCEVFDSCEDCPYWVGHSECTWIPSEYVTVIK